MDPLAVIVLGGLAGLVVALALVARPVRAPRAAQQPEDDLDGLLEAVNARRRRRGEADLTADALREGGR